MNQELFYDVQEALLYVLWPFLAWFCAFVVAGGVFAGLTAVAFTMGQGANGNSN